MKLKVWTERKPQEEKPTRVRLIAGASNVVELCVVDEEGERVNRGTIATLDETGLHRSSFFSDNTGLPVDGDRRICLT